MLLPGAVEMEDGLISWVGDPWQVPAAVGTEVRELGGILMPGLVNCHGHSPMTLVRSAGDGLPLERWLTESVWPREAKLRDEDVYWGMVLGAAELLANGVTTTCEQYRHPDPVIEALIDSGIRAMFTPGIFDVPGAGSQGTWEALLGEACRVFDTMEGREGRLHLGFGPHAVYTVPREGLRVDRGRGATPRGAAADPPLGDEARVRHGAGEPRHERPRRPGIRGRARGPRPGRPCRVARRGRSRDRRRARRGGGALPRFQREAGRRGGPAPGAARPRGAGGPGDRRARLQRRPPPVGRDAPGRPAGPGGRHRCGRGDVGRCAPAGHRGARARRSACRWARSRWAGRPT